MKLRLTEFGVRENTASSRQHASRLAVGGQSNTIRIGEEELKNFTAFSRKRSSEQSPSRTI
jgi:hypothetical protein